MSASYFCFEKMTGKTSLRFSFAPKPHTKTSLEMEAGDMLEAEDLVAEDLERKKAQIRKKVAEAKKKQQKDEKEKNRAKAEEKLMEKQRLEAALLHQPAPEPRTIQYSLDDPKMDHTAAAVHFDKNGDINMAIRAFQSAVRFSPNPGTLCNLGVALMRVKHFAEAYPLLKQAHEASGGADEAISRNFFMCHQTIQHMQDEMASAKQAQEKEEEEEAEEEEEEVKPPVATITAGNIDVDATDAQVTMTVSALCIISGHIDGECCTRNSTIAHDS
jgi:tetratricopeptide (TPR) repeat protein